MEFDMPKDVSSIIKVIGVGGGGSNAVNYMYNLGIKGVDFIVCNTDKQALDVSPVPFKVQLGSQLTEGRGAGSLPDIGREAAMETIEEIQNLLSGNTKMVFVTAGMGGGTGTGAAPVIAQVAKELGILTVGIVTVPFAFEGRKRRQQAESGLEQIREYVDTLLVINNEKLREITGNLTVTNAFSKADGVLSTAAKSIADVISATGTINVDFNDVKTVMKDSGVAIMGSGVSEGENRAIECVEAALQSPLLNDNDITGADYVLLNITYGDVEVTMDEITTITDYVQDQAGNTAEIIFGHGYDPTLGSQLSVTLIATGFQSTPFTEYAKAPQKTKVVLDDAPKNEITEPLVKPTETVEKSEEFNMYLKTAEVEKEEAVSKVPSFEAVKAQEENHVQEDRSQSVPSSNQFVFELETKEEHVVEEPKVTKYNLDGELSDTSSDNAEKRTVSSEEQSRMSAERLEQIRKYTSSIRQADGLSKYEKEPAYLRRNIDLDNTKPSEDNNTSRFSVSNDNDNNTLRGNNSFLHDNVD